MKLVVVHFILRYFKNLLQLGSAANCFRQMVVANVSFAKQLYVAKGNTN